MNPNGMRSEVVITRRPCWSVAIQARTRAVVKLEMILLAAHGDVSFE